MTPCRVITLSIMRMITHDTLNHKKPGSSSVQVLRFAIIMAA